LKTEVNIHWSVMGNCQTVDKYIVPAYNKISMHSHFDMEKPMKSISIRGVDDQLATLLKREAKAAQKSINQFVLEVLKKQVGLDKKRQYTQVYSDLDTLFGRWSKNEFDEIQSKIDSERRIEQELWQ